MDQFLMNRTAGHPFAKPYFHRRRFGRHAQGGFLPSEVMQIYQQTKVTATKTPTIAIIELGGGYYLQDNVAAFAAMGLPVPVIQNVGVQGAKNNPGDDADGEVGLDIQAAAGCYSYLTGRAANILMIWAPNSDGGFAAAVAAAGQHGASTLSISWGSAERNWTSSAVAAMNSAFQANLAAGCTSFAASGDNNAGDGGPGNNADFPASSPYCVGCGGTTIQTSNPLSEHVWNDGMGDGTGGGVSSLFPKPAYQPLGVTNFGNLTSRGIPDVAGNADPQSGWKIWINGNAGVIGGTSAVAPMWAGIVAAAVAAGAVPGDLFARIYKAPAGAFRDIVSGNNGSFQAVAGYDLCTGVGTPGPGLMAYLVGSTLPQPPIPPQPPVPPTPPSGISIAAEQKLLMAFEADPTTNWLHRMAAGIVYPSLSAWMKKQGYPS